MATIVIMPKQGQSVESCILTEIKKKKGDTVVAGDTLFTYETDKASFEEEAQTAGTVLEIFFDEGDEIPVLANVMIIGQPGESTAEFPPRHAERPATDLPTAQTPPEPDVTPAATIPPEYTETTSPASPRARALADKNAIRPENLTGTGPHQRVIERDVQALIDNRPKTTPLAKTLLKETGAPLPTSGSGPDGRAKGADTTAKNPAYASDSETKPLTNIRRIIAAAMHASLQNSAQLTHHLGADARNILALRKKIKKALREGFPTDITLNDLVCLALIRALRKHPSANAHFLGDRIRQFNKVHLGLAVDTERGLMVPVIRNADDLSLQGLSDQLKEAARACKKGNIAPDLLTPEAASFTLSNLGNYGVEIFTPVINLPQVAILGVNTILPRPKDLGDGLYGFVPHMGLSLTYDHRALDGAQATRFLKQVATEIETLEFNI
jgi:pyruvate dehydrogenase E2 component (dihydrolipoamide acetyltransferase)